MNGYLEPRIFLSYRRDGSSGHVQALYGPLTEFVGPNNVFRDLDSIRPGEPFFERIHRTIEASTTMLIVIGPQWLSTMTEDGRPRLFEPDDPVSAEVAQAMEISGDDPGRLQIIPVLLDDARMPRATELPPDQQGLVTLNAARLRVTDWDHDVRRLLDSLATPAIPQSAPRPVSAGPKQRKKRWAGATLLVLALPCLLGLVAVGAVGYGAIRIAGSVRGAIAGQTLTVDPVKGPSGTTVTLAASGFDPGENVQFTVNWPPNVSGDVIAADPSGVARWRVTLSKVGFGTEAALSVKGESEFRRASADFVFIE